MAPRSKTTEFKIAGESLSKKSILLALGLTMAAGLFFAIWQDVDLRVAAWFFDSGKFTGRTGAGRLLRNILFYGPLIVPVVMLICWLLPRVGRPVPAHFVPANRTVVFLALSLALGPTLLVNFGLKEYSGRPRPNQIQEFGGSREFRPWYKFDGACQNNCSFVSGEVSTAAWLVGPASLLPAPWKTPAMAGAVAIAAVTGILRMAFGGHFLSDVIFAILFTLLTVQAVGHWILRSRRKPG